MSRAFSVGYSSRSITPPLGAPLSGVAARNGRFCSRIRDPLFVKAVHFDSEEGAATLVVADVLVITDALHRAVARKAGIDTDELVLTATHTHSGPGAYWDAGRAQLFMGSYSREAFESLSDALAEAARDARHAPKPARLRAASKPLVGASSNRRQLHGPIDPELTVVRIDVEGESAIDLVSYGAHPVIGSEREPEVCSADFPGAVCERIERRGRRAVFVTGVVGGLSPLFPEFPMRFEDHLELYASLLDRGYEETADGLATASCDRVEVARLDVPIDGVSCRMFPRAGPLWGAAELASYPLRRWMRSMGRDARNGSSATLHYLRLGEVALVGAPSDLGVRVGLELKRALRESGVKYPITGSQCDGYVGYVHLPEDYEHVPEAGFREMTFYENAMSLSGRQLGRQWVTRLEHHLADVSG